jgi:hypothetical protein
MMKIEIIADNDGDDLFILIASNENYDFILMMIIIIIIWWWWDRGVLHESNKFMMVLGIKREKREQTRVYQW